LAKVTKCEMKVNCMGLQVRVYSYTGRQALA